jgi:HEAT repeat protein
MGEVPQRWLRGRRSGDRPDDRELARPSADEWIDPEFDFTDPEEEAERQARVRASLAAMGPMQRELAELGVDLDMLLGDPPLERARPAVPVLVKWLPRMESIDVRDTIVRALCGKWAAPVATPVLLEEFRNLELPVDYRWVVGRALALAEDEAILDDLLDLAGDRRYGYAREGVVEGLLRFHDPRVRDVLIDLLDPDDEVRGHAATVLAARRERSAEPSLRHLRDDPDPLVRERVRDALRLLAGHR